jgi:hypothetical protein
MEYVPLHSLRVQLYHTFYSIPLFVFSTNRIRQNASDTNASHTVLYKTNNECLFVQW